VGSQYAVLAVADPAAQGGVFFTTSGLDHVTHPVAAPDLHAGALGEVLAQRRAWRACSAEGAPLDSSSAVQAGLPPGYPQAHAFLAVPLMTPARTFGWLCLADRIGGDCFDGDDEKLLLTLGGQVGRTLENTRLHSQLRRQSARLERVHAMLGGIQGLIANGQDDEEICKAACQLCIEAGGYQQAFVEVGETSERDDLVELATSNRSPVICNDLQTTQLRVRRREELLRRGYRSMAVLPLGSSGRRLILAREEPCAFDEAELRLLRDVAAGFSLALARNSETAVGS
jgi:GAF domain-containing protein